MNKFIEIPVSKKSLAQRKPILGLGINDANYIVQPRVNGKRVTCPYYKAWMSMINRCYGEKIHLVRPTYKGCSIVNEWLTFTTFKDWMIKQDWKGKQLDKDIISYGNKIYSPETCIFVSSSINNLLTDSAAKRGDLPTGVCFKKDTGKYQSYCNVNGVKKFIGYFSTANKAEYSYLKFKSLLVDKISRNSEASKNNKLREALTTYSILLNNRSIKVLKRK